MCQAVAEQSSLTEKLTVKLGLPRVWHPPLTDTSYSPSSSFSKELPERTDPSDEASLHAIKALHGDIKLSTIDVIISRGALRNLLDYASGRQYPFAIGMRCFGKTLSYFRLEERPRPPTNPFQGNREQFLKDYTSYTIPVERYSAHRCVVKYKFAGLTFLVRTFVDAFSKDLVPELTHSSLLEAIRDIRMIDEEPVQDSSKAKVTVRKAGCDIPLTGMIEITTKAKHSKNQFDLQRKLPSLWISRLPNHVLAQYENHSNNPYDRSRQIFNDVRLASIEGEIEEWEEQHQIELKKLAMIMQWLVKIVRQRDGPSVVSCLGEELTVNAAPENSELELPDDLKALFKE